jgi:DNA repair photolyase
MVSPTGPRRIWNPPNPFDPSWTDLEVESAPVELETYEDQSRSVLSHNDSPDLGFRWSVNPYRGCMHACAYCYARPTHEYLGLGAGTDFERKIFLKPDAAALLDAAFRKRSWKRELVVFSGVTDCYQPLEASWRLTRACLEVCERHANPVGIVTKSVLVVRDIDILVRLSRCAAASVSISIPFASDEMARRIEPSAPSIKRRFDAVRQLAAAGVRVGVGVAPIIPGLNDREVPEILTRAKENGAGFAFRTLLREACAPSFSGVLPKSIRSERLTSKNEFVMSAAAIFPKADSDIASTGKENTGEPSKGCGTFGFAKCTSKTSMPRSERLFPRPLPAKAISSPDEWDLERTPKCVPSMRFLG